MVLLIDNFDSFSHILADYLRQAGIALEIVRNDVALDKLTSKSWEALILSPGPESPSKAGNLMKILGYYAGKLPILGICLGHQAIGEYFGGKLVKCKRPVHGKVHHVYKSFDHNILKGLPESFMVTRYHSLEIEKIPDCLQVILQTQQGEIMAMTHKTLPILGIQYHPEAFLTQFGKDLIFNWLQLSNIDHENFEK
ncbi:aminodeoxychorismate/anthranilate synthase component II [Aquiflexum sp. TKW24L]|uniref:anthranilate synthase component II n=1 Tax=Aquiflexum sp. TKW24L TaxID=2942212 RepID=UPI0020C0E0EC|nr:aminodeoxychorismate/anthranilate synthase component II [Aquiflexum sp. TKW24L]MCL6259251.1 aminodeoxychorismate/anthranilate synthase component II [Aquiflexum sp. TKW24L]